jgi:hypothetical protein
MRESSNFCENRLSFYRDTVNAALGPSVSFPPLFGVCSVKTDRLYSETAPVKVKTASAREIASALRLKALMDSIDAAGGKITVEFPDAGEWQ